jgi:hypothetical protein
MTKRKTDNTMAKRKTDNTMAKGKTENAMTKRKTNFFYSAVPRTEDIKTMVSFIQQSLEKRISKQWFLFFNSH